MKVLKLRPIRQTGHNCKVTALATLDRYFGQKLGFHSLPLHKEARGRKKDEDDNNKIIPEIISMREVAKKFGSIQGELLEVIQLKNILESIGYDDVEVVDFSDDESKFRDVIKHYIDQEIPLIVFFAIDPKTRMPSVYIEREGNSNNEHAAVINGYDEEEDKVIVTHSGQQFTLGLQELLQASMELPTERKSETYARNNRVEAKDGRYALQEKDDPRTSLETLKPKKNSGFKGKLVVAKSISVEHIKAQRKDIFKKKYPQHKNEEAYHLPVSLLSYGKQLGYFQGVDDISYGLTRVFRDYFINEEIDQFNEQQIVVMNRAKKEKVDSSNETDDFFSAISKYQNPGSQQYKSSIEYEYYNNFIYGLYGSQFLFLFFSSLKNNLDQSPVYPVVLTLHTGNRLISIGYDKNGWTLNDPSQTSSIYKIEKENLVELVEKITMSLHAHNDEIIGFKADISFNAKHAKLLQNRLNHWVNSHDYKIISPSIMFSLAPNSIISKKDVTSNTLLHYAVLAGDIYFVKDLIEKMKIFNANLNSLNEDRETPLHLATRLGRLDMVRLLVQGGANPLIKNNRGETCLAVAETNGKANIIKFFNSLDMPKHEILSTSLPEYYSSWFLDYVKASMPDVPERGICYGVSYTANQIFLDQNIETLEALFKLIYRIPQKELMGKLVKLQNKISHIIEAVQIEVGPLRELKKNEYSQIDKEEMATHHIQVKKIIDQLIEEGKLPQEEKDTEFEKRYLERLYWVYFQQKIEEKKKSQLTVEEALLINVFPWFGTIMAYQQGYAEAFPDSTGRNMLQNAQFYMPMLIPASLEKKGGIVDVFEYGDTYDFSRLTQYFESFRECAQDVTDFPISFVFGNINHVIQIGYHPKLDFWYLVDAANLPPRYIQYKDSQFLVKMVIESLGGFQESAMIESRIFVSKDNEEQAKKIVDAWKKHHLWNEFHGVSGRKMLQEDKHERSLLAFEMKQFLRSAHHSRDQIERIKNLLGNGADTNKLSETGSSLLETPFHQAIQSENQELIEAMIQAKADVNFPNEAGMYPLGMVVSRNAELTKVLLKAGADINLNSVNADPYLYLAFLMENKAAIHPLLAAGADPNFISRDEELLFLHLFLIAKDYEFVEAVAEKTDLTNYTETKISCLPKDMQNKLQRLNIKNTVEITPLAFAVCTGDYKNVELILKKGADPNLGIRGEVEMTSLAMALALDQVDMANLIDSKLKEQTLIRKFDRQNSMESPQRFFDKKSNLRIRQNASDTLTTPSIKSRK